MIFVLAADAGEMSYQGDPGALEDGSIAQSGSLEHERRAQGATRDDDGLASFDDTGAGRWRLFIRFLVKRILSELDAHSPAVLDQDTNDLALDDNMQIWIVCAVLQSRMQVSRGCILPLAVLGYIPQCPLHSCR